MLVQVSSPLWLPDLWEEDCGELLGWMPVAAPSEKKKKKRFPVALRCSRERISAAKRGDRGFIWMGQK